MVGAPGTCRCEAFGRKDSRPVSMETKHDKTDSVGILSARDP